MLVRRESLHPSPDTVIPEWNSGFRKMPTNSVNSLVVYILGFESSLGSKSLVGKILRNWENKIFVYHTFLLY